MSLIHLRTAPLPINLRSVFTLFLFLLVPSPSLSASRPYVPTKNLTASSRLPSPGFSETHRPPLSTNVLTLSARYLSAIWEPYRNSAPFASCSGTWQFKNGIRSSFTINYTYNLELILLVNWTCSDILKESQQVKRSISKP